MNDHATRNVLDRQTGGNARFDNAAIRDGSAARWIKISETEH